MAVGERIKGETELAWTYFQLYRDQENRPRSLRDLTELEINGKKRFISQMGTWSSQYNWQDRVEEWDREQARSQARASWEKRQADIAKFIADDFRIAEKVQKLTERVIDDLETKGTTTVHTLAFRQVTLAYKEGRANLKELIGVIENSEEN